jgi:8-oxo-dGTP pyrophosphatase MutT (NUDIX family)
VDEKKSKAPLATGIELIQDISDVSNPLEGFLHRHRHRAKTRLSDGKRTDVYVADFIDRDPARRNAVTIVIASLDQGRAANVVQVLLRRQVRYAAYLVNQEPLFLELVAGVIESPETPNETTRRELYEETGLDVPIERISTLGEPFFVLPGTVTEQLVPMLAVIPEETLLSAIGSVPPGDGSPMEEGADLVAMTLEEALARARGELQPSIRDAKTEIGLSRLERALAKGAL